MALNRNRRRSLLLLAFDLVAAVLVFNLVTYIRGISTSFHVLPYLAPALVFVATVRLIDGYGAGADMLSLDYASLHLIASVFAALVTLFLTFLFIPSGFSLQSSRAVIVVSLAILGPITLAWRRLLFERSVVSRSERTIVFVGDRPEFETFSEEYSRMGDTMRLLHAEALTHWGEFEQVLQRAGGGHSVEAIVLRESGRELPPDVPMRLVQLFFDGVPTYTLELFHQVYWRKIPLYRINPVWLFQEGFKVAREPIFERIKRLSDVLLAAVGLVLFAPVVAAAAIAIKLEGGGPVFFVQTRIGRHKIPFRLLKLRTMRVSAAGGDPYTQLGDSRVTRVGSLLRAARLDELPQLWNVLRGEMSLIGPRAEWDQLVAEYEREIPCYHFRHMVKPGITGWAQINYRYGQGLEDTLRKLEYDLYYIQNFSFMLDASIVLKTIHVMLLRKGR